MHNWNTEKIHWIMADGVSQLGKLKKKLMIWSLITMKRLRTKILAIMIEDQLSLGQKLKMLVNYWRKQVYVNMHLRELEDEGEADI